MPPLGLRLAVSWKPPLTIRISKYNGLCTMLESNGWSFRNRLVRKKLGLTLVSEKTHGLSTPVAAPPALITLPGRSYPHSDLTAACAGLILAPPKTANLN